MEDRQRNISVTVGTDNTVLSEARNTNTDRRKSFTATNTSTAGQVINITFTDESGAGLGAQLNVGGFVALAEDLGYIPPQGRINAISSAAGGSVAVWETIADQR
jgi:myo-inositol-hexaphosphate 3-phosphohydrolase